MTNLLVRSRVPVDAAPVETAPVFHARGLTKTYLMGEVVVPALQGVDLDLLPRELVVILGPSGSGKSTLLKKLNFGDYASVPSELAKWDTSKGKRVQGLVNRRAAEAGLWAKGSFVSSNTVEAKPAKPPVLTIDNAVKVATPASAILQNFTSGPAQIILALAFVAGAAFLFWRWHKGQQEASA